MGFVSGFVQKRGKRRWIFRKHSNNNETGVQLCETRTITTRANSAETTGTARMAKNPVSEAADAEKRHAIAVAMATAAAAEAAVVTAKAAVEVARLTRRPSIFVREHCAAIVIQTAFRGYLVYIELSTISYSVYIRWVWSDKSFWFWRQGRLFGRSKGWWSCRLWWEATTSGSEQRRLFAACKLWFGSKPGSVISARDSRSHTRRKSTPYSAILAAYGSQIFSIENPWCVRKFFWEILMLKASSNSLV